MIVDFELCVKIEKPFPASFLANDYRIMSIRMINAGNVPESWVGSGFTASLPVPKANNEAQGICISGKSENVTLENEVKLSWATPDGTMWSSSETCKLVGAEQQNGDRVPHNKTGPMIVWNTERRVLMSTSDADTFQNRIATFAQNLPVEIARAREAEGGKKVLR